MLPQLYPQLAAFWSCFLTHCIFHQTLPYIIITDLYSAFKSEDTEALDAVQED